MSPSCPWPIAERTRNECCKCRRQKMSDGLHSAVGGTALQVPALERSPAAKEAETLVTEQRGTSW